MAKSKSSKKGAGDRRLLGKKSWSTDTSDDTTDDGVCGCSVYLDDSSSTSTWSSGKKTSSSGKKNSRRRLSKKSWSTDTTDCDNTWSSGKKSNSKWSTGTNPCSTSTTEEPFDNFCDCSFASPVVCSVVCSVVFTARNVGPFAEITPVIGSFNASILGVMGTNCFFVKF